ncbi:ras-related protein Rab-39A-like [Oscarella lobularis]|uniref:ras-related protein Rab-39A-like n=1 Tax=Oscarella lobularis TaxID=121494 RepID=UPI0033134FA9
MPVKLVLACSSAVGKTCFFTMFETKTFPGFHLGATLEVSSAKVEVDVGRMMTVSIWDTAGQERFNSVNPSYYRRAAGAILMFDLSRKETLKDIDRHIKQIYKVVDPSEIVLVLVGKQK